jgi:hypothetical protein
MPLPRKNQKDRGFIKTIILIVVLLLIISYLGFNLREIVSSPTTRDNFSFAKSVVVNVWNNYIVPFFKNVKPGEMDISSDRAEALVPAKASTTTNSLRQE